MGMPAKIDLPMEAQVCRVLAALKMSPLHFYIISRIYCELLPPPNVAMIAADVEGSHATVYPTVKRLIDDDLVRKNKDGILSLSDNGRAYFLLAFGQMNIPPPDHLNPYLAHSGLKKRHVGHMNPLKYTVQRLRELISRATPREFESWLAMFGIKKVDHGNQRYSTQDSVQDPGESKWKKRKGARL